MRGVSQAEPKATVVVTLSGPFGRSFDFRQHRLGHGELGEDLARRAVEQLALLGQDQSARVAVEQRHAQALLERADLAAHRRLAEIQRLAGMGEAAGLGDGMEDPQLVPIHAGHAAYSAALKEAASSAARNFSASSAAMQPMPAAVTAWRKILSRTSPAAKTPGMSVAVESGRVRM